MAIKTSDYISLNNESNIKMHKTDKSMFLFDFRIEGKRYRKTFKIKQDITAYNKKTLINMAKKELAKFKDSIEEGFSPTKKLKLSELFSLYYGTLDKRKSGTIQKQKIYNRYIINHLGDKPIESIKEMHVKYIMLGMEQKGLKPKTIKGILEVLKPLFVFAIKNKFLRESPVQFLTIKVPNQKKIVTNATTLFQEIYNGIIELYKDNPFYKTLFLFAFTGRRKNEILSLKWEHIDLNKNYYWLEHTKNGENQKFELSLFIKESLLSIHDERKGLVFKSPITGQKLSNIDRQKKNLIKHLVLKHCNDNPIYQAYRILKSKEKTTDYINNLKWNDKFTKDIEEILKKYNGKKGIYVFEDLEIGKFNNLSPHYMRNILVSMLAENGIEAITLSGILGHNDVNTINKYLSINYLDSSKKGHKKIDTILDAEVIENG